MLETNFRSIQDHYDHVLNDISLKYKLPIDTINVTVHSDPFYDATHLSGHAVLEVSEGIKRRLKMDSTNRIFVLKISHLE